MVDISLCTACKVCPVSNTCKRNPVFYKDSINQWQSWMGPSLHEITEAGCNSYVLLPSLSENVPDRKKRKKLRTVADQLADSELWDH